MTDTVRTSMCGGTTLPRLVLTPRQASGHGDAHRRAFAALLCRALLWVFAIFATSEAPKFGEPGHVRFGSPVAGTAVRPLLIERTAAFDLCDIAVPAANGAKSDWAGSCDEAAFWPTAVTVPLIAPVAAAAHPANMPADRTPPGQASARAPPFAGLA